MFILYIYMVTKSRLSIVFERVDGVFGGGFEGRVDPKDNANDKRGKESDGQNMPADERGKWRHYGDEESEKIAEHEPKYAAKH